MTTLRFSSREAHHTPTAFSDDIRTPFEDIGMREWSDDQVASYFADKTVLDIGSGFEGIARRLYGIFGDSETAPTVVNVNPQFTDWRMEDLRINGELKCIPRSKRLDIAAGMETIMEMAGEDYQGYFESRVAAAGLAQQLSFRDQAFDIVTSTWGFPNCFYDCWGSDKDHEAGYKEVMRVLKPGGIALLAPLRRGEIKHTMKRLDGARIDLSSYDFTETTPGSFVLKLSKPDGILHDKA